MRLYGPIILSSASGENGRAASSATTGVRLAGSLVGFYVDYTVTSTPDLRIYTQGNGAAVPSYTLLEVTTSTDGWFYPRALDATTAGALLTQGENLTAQYSQIPVFDYLVCSLENANSGDTAKVWVMMTERTK